MKKILYMTLALVLASCASYKETIHSLDDSSKPSWVELDSPTWEKDGKIYSVSIAEVPHDSNFSSAKRISDNTARVQLSKILGTKLENTLNVQELNLKSKEYNLNSTEKVSMLVKGIVVEKNWFEIVEVDNLDETKRKEMHVYSLVSISKEKFEKLAQDISKSKERTVATEK